MRINHILFLSPMNNELQRLIKKLSLAKDIRFLSEEQLIDTDLDWADAFVTFKTRAGYDYSRVKWVHSLGAGVDHFLHDNKWPEDVILTRMICSFGERISEYCLSYILKDLQSHDQFQALQSHKEWQSITPKMLSESKILIYGTGEIGQKIAQAISFFGVNVYGVSLSGKQKDFFKKVFSLDDHYPLLEEMDFIINTLPLTSDTENMLNKDIFSYLSDAVLINVGRGKSLSEGDLIHAIKNGKIRLAVLDVLAEEPLPKYHELWNHPQVIITPHISAVTTAEEAVESFVDTLSRIEKNQPLYNRVDIEKGY